MGTIWASNSPVTESMFFGFVWYSHHGWAYQARNTRQTIKYGYDMIIPLACNKVHVFGFMWYGHHGWAYRGHNTSHKL